MTPTQQIAEIARNTHRRIPGNPLSLIAHADALWRVGRGKEASALYGRASAVLAAGGMVYAATVAAQAARHVAV